MANAIGNGFGRPVDITGGAGTFRSTRIPHEVLDNLARQQAIPITISGSNQVTFAVSASKTNPVWLWTGNDFFVLKESKSYTFVGGATNTLLASDGSSGSTNSVASTAPYYFYMGIDDAGTLHLTPSLSAPSYVEGPLEGPVLGHPGTSRAMFWQYVGVSIATTASTAPVFLAMTKHGFKYSHAAQAVQTTSLWASIDFSATLPKHNVEAAGYLEVAVGGTPTAGVETAEVGSSTVDVQGAFILTSNTPTLTTTAPFSGVVASSAGKLYGAQTLAASKSAAKVAVTGFRDMV